MRILLSIKIPKRFKLLLLLLLLLLLILLSIIVNILPLLLMWFIRFLVHTFLSISGFILSRIIRLWWDKLIWILLKTITFLWRAHYHCTIRILLLFWFKNIQIIVDLTEYLNWISLLFWEICSLTNSRRRIWYLIEIPIVRETMFRWSNVRQNSIISIKFVISIST